MSTIKTVPPKNPVYKENVFNYPGTQNIEIETENLSLIEITKIEWVWQDILAKGKITLFAGEPGVGKSQLLLYIAHILSIGGTFHFSKNPTEKTNVLLIAGEDKTSDTVKPRLQSLGADLNCIDHLKGIKKLDKFGREFYEPISLADHLPDIENLIINKKYGVIIIDPVSLYLGSADDSKNKEIRSIMAHLTAVIERHNVIAILNSHFTKPSGNVTKNAIYRVMGSIGFAAAARIVYGIMKDPENPDRRLFIPIKNNIAQDKEGFVFNISFDNGCSKITWLDEKVTQTANEILNPEINTNPTKLQEAKLFLSEILKDGSQSLTKIRDEAKKRGISADRLYAAKKELSLYEDFSIERGRGKIWMLSS